MYKSKVDFSKITGKIKPLHGVNNGPLEYIFLHNTSEYFKQARIPFSRLHDTEGTYSAGEFVDVPAIFKNFDADPEDPAAYDFTCTDRYLKGIKDCGTDIIYRLGVSIENAAGAGKVPAMHINPPKDYLKWAKICEHIIKHYNEGWADGFHMNIKYWEIWNEPESEAQWTKSFEEFINFYIEAGSYLKNCFPKLKFGGYGSIGFYPLTRKERPFDGEPYTSLIVNIEKFLKTVKEKNAPLDFFSWHLYSDNIEEFILYAEEARRLLDKYGFESCESILDEWNTDAGPKKIEGLHGAAYSGAVLCALQKSSVDISTYYDARMPTWYNGLFKANGRIYGKTIDPLKTFFTFRAFGELYSLGNSVQVSYDSGIYICAAKKGDESAILLVNHSEDVKEIETEVSGLSDKVSEITTYLISEEHDLEQIKRESITDTSFRLYNTLEPHNVILIKMKDWDIIL